MQRVLLVTTAVLAVVTSAAATPGVPLEGKARCKTVIKKIHGKKKRVRVCKRAPKPFPQAGSIVATLPLGATVASVAAGDGSIWATTDDRKLLRIDPATNTVVATISLPASEWPEDVAYGNGAGWVAVASPSTVSQPELDSVLRVDPQTNQIVARIHVGHSPIGIAFTPGAVWAADPQDSGHGFVIRIDPATNTVAATVPVADTAGGACGGMAGDDTAIWLASGCDNPHVVRIDPASNKLAAVIQVRGAAVSLALGSGSLWATTNSSFDFVGLTRIDPATNKVVGRTAVPSVDQLAFGSGSIWVASGQNLVRINPPA